VATYTLTLARAQEYAKRFDFRTAIVKAARQILADYDIVAVGPGDGVEKIPRYFTSVDFQRGAATGRKSPVALGDRRYLEYSEYFGTFSILNTVPMETDERTGDEYLTPDHARELERLTSLEDAIFMEHHDAWSALLPLHEVTECFPIEPDERPINEREVNAAFRRWRLKVNIRYDAWPTA
jgi:hypothetical protein